MTIKLSKHKTLYEPVIKIKIYQSTQLPNLALNKLIRNNIRLCKKNISYLIMNIHRLLEQCPRVQIAHIFQTPILCYTQHNINKAPSEVSNSKEQLFISTSEVTGIVFGMHKLH